MPCVRFDNNLTQLFGRLSNLTNPFKTLIGKIVIERRLPSLLRNSNQREQVGDVIFQREHMGCVSEDRSTPFGNHLVQVQKFHEVEANVHRNFDANDPF